MFKELGQIAGLLKNLPKMREEMQKLHGRLSQVVVEGDAGAGMVTVKVNGQLELVSCVLSDEAAKVNDKEFLEDLIVSAANQALRKAREAVAEETKKMAGDFGLPPGVNLPGLTE